jgi:hypothetical protein
MATNTQRFKRLVKSGSATPIAVGAGVGAIVGLVTGPVILCAAIGAVAGLALGRKRQWK